MTRSSVFSWLGKNASASKKAVPAPKAASGFLHLNQEKRQSSPAPTPSSSPGMRLAEIANARRLKGKRHISTPDAAPGASSVKSTSPGMRLAEIANSRRARTKG